MMLSHYTYKYRINILQCMMFLNINTVITTYYTYYVHIIILCVAHRHESLNTIQDFYIQILQVIYLPFIFYFDYIDIPCHK